MRGVLHVEPSNEELERMIGRLEERVDREVDYLHRDVAELDDRERTLLVAVTQLQEKHSRWAVLQLALTAVGSALAAFIGVKD
jgi:hypothetical protein